MTRFKYWFIMIWHFYIIGDAWWVLLESNIFNLGEIIEATYGTKMEVIWKRGDEILVIEWK